MDIREMVVMLWKRTWIIALIVFLSSLTTGLCSYYLLQPVYKASTKLIVSTATIEEGEPQLTWSDVNLNIQLIATYKELIKTATIMEEVLKQHPEIDLSVNELIDMVNVSSVNETQVMTVEVEDTNYARAALIVNSVSTVFQAKVIEIMNVDNVTILNEAYSDGALAPISPNPTMNIVISFILSLMFAVGIAFLMEHLDDSIKNEEDVEKYLGLPTLAVIHKLDKKDIAKQRLARSNKKVGDNVHVATN